MSSTRTATTCGPLFHLVVSTEMLRDARLLVWLCCCTPSMNHRNCLLSPLEEPDTVGVMETWPDHVAVRAVPVATVSPGVQEHGHGFATVNGWAGEAASTLPAPS